MKTFQRVLFIGVITLFLSPAVKATHILGMNIAYKHHGGDTFLITLDFWRYCGGTAFNNGTCVSAAGGSNSMSYQIYCPDQGFSNLRTVPLDTVIDVSPICGNLSSTLNSCVVGSCGLMGIQRYIYTDTLVFNELAQATCSEWLLVYQTGARNTGTNYVGQPSIVSYAKLRMDNFPDNSSPILYATNPVPVFCDGQPVSYHWSAIEPDGDSLWWELDTAWDSWSSTTGFDPITYETGYSAPQPMPGVTINPQTGQLHFTAQVPSTSYFANYAIAVTVSEYEPGTGTFKGSVHRDVQFIVGDSCDNIPPSNSAGIINLDGGSLVDSNEVNVCEGDSFGFDIVFYDLDSSGNLSNDLINAFCDIDQVLPGASWTSSGTNPDTIHITGTNIQPNSGQVVFYISVTDNYCPSTASNSYAYIVNIGNVTSLGPDTTICADDTIWLEAQGGASFYWSVLSGPPLIVGTNIGCNTCNPTWVHPSQTTVYKVQSNLSTFCGNNDSITVTVFDKYPINLTPLHGGTVAPLIYCATDPEDTLLSQTPGGTYYGSGIIDDSAGAFDPGLLDPGIGQDTTVGVLYILPGSCPNIDTLFLSVKGAPDASITTTGPFDPQLTFVQLLSVTAGGWWWDENGTGNPDSAGGFDPSQFTAPDSVMVFHMVDVNGCIGLDSAFIYIDTIPDSTSDSTISIRTIQYSSRFDVRLLPNPAKTKVELTVLHQNTTFDRIRIFDVKGATVLDQRAGTSAITLDISPLYPGYYSVETLLSDGRTIRQPLIIE